MKRLRRQLTCFPCDYSLCTNCLIEFWNEDDEGEENENTCHELVDRVSYVHLFKELTLNLQ